jgi:hypothetical protein
MKAFYVVLLTLVLGWTGCRSSEQNQLEQRQADVAEKGAEVMPFDLDATTHIFKKTPEGGVQQVVADSDDAEQVRLIREHLQTISTQFAAGNFHDPTMIHGPEMVGLHALVMGHDRLSITYREIDMGAEITYSSEDPKLVDALHSWFDAQVADHGEHAQSQ